AESQASQPPTASAWQSPETVAPERSRVNATPKRSVVAPLGLPRELVNSIGMKFVLVKPGTFLMGSPAEEADRANDETQHEVMITRPYWLGVYPVTQGQWKTVMSSNPSHFSRTGEGKDSVKDVSDAEFELFPIESVSWEDAQAFLKKLAAL